MTTIKLYELAGAEENRRFSPYCWRARFALMHKGLAYETIPWRVTEKERIAFANHDQVPVMIDGDRVVVDSCQIADYLETTYCDRPSLYGCEAGRSLARFITSWVDTVLQPGIFPMIALDIHNHLHPGDQMYFRKGREQQLGCSLEAICADRETRLPEFRNCLQPLRTTLQHQPFISGQSPAWADYVVFATFQWARCISPLPLIVPDDPVYEWRDRMLDLFGGVARKVPAYDY